MLTCSNIPFRKRRRQNYHARLANKLKQSASVKASKTGRTRQTIDKGEWEEAPSKPRRQIFINDKLKVVRRLKKLRQEKDKATQVVYERIPAGMSNEERKKMQEKKAAAKKVLKRNVLRECAKEFAKIVGNCQVWKWERQCDRERWEDIPESDRVRWLEVPNGWRSKLKIAKKGRKTGGVIPLPIQEELDRLLAEHVLGASDITERKEVVSWADLEPRLSWLILAAGTVL